MDGTKRGLLRLIAMRMYPTDSFGLVRREAAHLVGICDREIASAIRDDHLLRLYPECMCLPATTSPDARCATTTPADRDRDRDVHPHRRPDSAYRSRLRCGDARGAAAEAEYPAGSCGHRAVVGRRNPVGIGTCAAPIDDDEITTVDGIAVTSL